MFCPSCGAEYTIELNYCKRCGANLSTALTAQPEMNLVNLTKPTLIIAAALVLLTLGGFGAVIAGALSLARVVHGDEFLAVIPLGMITILAVDICLVRQLSKLISASLKSEPQRSIRKQAAPLTGELPRLYPTQLPAAPSVTENTTRFFEHAHRASSEKTEQPRATNVEN